jgi:hypothetical protein
MGYVTDYTLSIDLDLNVALGLEIKKEREQEVLRMMLEKDPDGQGYLSSFVEKNEDTGELSASPHNSFKWYGHEEDMRSLSAKCGDILFRLEGKGEEDDDRWIKYFMNGRMQSCPAEIVITYDEFDPEKMK